MGLHYNVARWYEPGVGRYTRPDPAGIILDLDLVPPRITTASGGPCFPSVSLGFEMNHLYGYADQSPVMYVDVNGAGPIGWILNKARCAYWGTVCWNGAKDCKERWECEIREMDEEQLAEHSSRYGVSSVSDLIFKVCFASRESCQKALKYCGDIAHVFP